jgi:hypothetical protein
MGYIYIHLFTRTGTQAWSVTLLPLLTGPMEKIQMPSQLPGEFTAQCCYLNAQQLNDHNDYLCPHRYTCILLGGERQVGVETCSGSQEASSWIWTHHAVCESQAFTITLHASIQNLIYMYPSWLQQITEHFLSHPSSIVWTYEVMHWNEQRTRNLNQRHHNIALFGTALSNEVW